jgi:hypothetical protein
MSDEPQFDAYRRRVMRGCFVLCIAAVPIGLILHLPYVWILGIVGTVVGAWKLSKLQAGDKERK